MSKINKKLIDKLAKDMYIKLDEEEFTAAETALKEFEASFEEINKNFPNLSEVEPMTHTIEIDDIILREDIPVDSPSREDLMKNATHVRDNQVEVPKVVG